MKAFSRILGSLVLVFVLFFFIGVFIPSVEYQFEMDMEGNDQEVFEALTNGDKLKEWVSHMESIECVKGSFGETDSEYDIVIESNGQQIIFHEIISKSEPNSKLNYSLTNQSVDAEVSIQLSSIELTTSVIVKTKLTGNAWFVRSFLPLYKQSLVEQNIRDYNNLKSLLMTH